MRAGESAIVLTLRHWSPLAFDVKAIKPPAWAFRPYLRLFQQPAHPLAIHLVALPPHAPGWVYPTIVAIVGVQSSIWYGTLALFFSTSGVLGGGIMEHE